MEDARSGDHPPLLDYRATALPTDAVNVLRPAARSIALVMLAIQLGATVFFVVLAFFDGISHDRPIGKTIKLATLASLGLLLALILTGVIWWLTVRRLRWAIREEGLIIARGQKIARSISWSEMIKVDVRSHGVVVRVTSRPQIVYLSPLGSCDGERVRRAWLQRTPSRGTPGAGRGDEKKGVRFTYPR